MPIKACVFLDAYQLLVHLDIWVHRKVLSDRGMCSVSFALDAQVKKLGSDIESR